VIERKVRNRSKPEPAEQDRDEPRQEEEEDETPGTPHPARTPAARVLEDPWLLKGRLHGISLPTSENFHVSSAEETVFPPRVLFDCALNRRHLPREERGLRAVRKANATRLDFRALALLAQLVEHLHGKEGAQRGGNHVSPASPLLR
jgi:hypothetical protein